MQPDIEAGEEEEGDGEGALEIGIGLKEEVGGDELGGGEGQGNERGEGGDHEGLVVP